MKNLITRNKGEGTLRQRKERSQDTSGKAKYRTHTQSDFFFNLRVNFKQTFEMSRNRKERANKFCQ